MKDEFTRQQLKQVLIEIKELMEMISVKERYSNKLLMKKYVTLFIESLSHFRTGEVWRS